MSKSILVIDTPNNCSECPCTDYMFCYTTQKELEIDWEANKPSWCPLEPMPDKKHMTVGKGKDCVSSVGEKDGYYMLGWNACIDSILGEEK